MRVLVSEFLCGGHWPETNWPESLLREGRAMLESVIEDLLALPHVSVVTTWDHRLPPPDLFQRQHLSVQPIRSSSQAMAVLQDLTQAADAALVIAPDFDGLLEQQCRMLGRCGLRMLNCTPAAIRHCADKLAVFQTCLQQRIPTVPTQELGTNPRWLPAVVKRRDGAGSIDMQLIRQPSDWTRWRETAVVGQFVEQPYLSGRSCSLAALFYQGQAVWFLPAAVQHLSDDGRFRYQGGSIPVENLETAPLHCSIEQFSRAVPGLQGYVGFDFLLPESGDPPLLVDVNPRLCTSYIGYRSICRSSLAAWLIHPDKKPGPEFQGSVSFAADGTCSFPSPSGKELVDSTAPLKKVRNRE